MDTWFLHGGHSSSSVISMFTMPLLVGVIGGAIAGLVLVFMGWRAGLVTAAIGFVLLTAGAIGDLSSHHAQGRERDELFDKLASSTSGSTVAQRLHDIDHSEAKNPWHFVTLGGQGAVLISLAGALFLVVQSNNKKSDDVFSEAGSFYRKAA